MAPKLRCLQRNAPVWMYFNPRSIWYRKNWWCSGVKSSLALITYTSQQRLSALIFYKGIECLPCSQDYEHCICVCVQVHVGIGRCSNYSGCTWCRSVSMSSNTT